MLAAVEGRQGGRIRRSPRNRRDVALLESGDVTPKIARFLAEQQPATPCLVVDLDGVEHNYRELARRLPLARVFYAVKANPEVQVLNRLHRLGSNFDTASQAGAGG